MNLIIYCLLTIALELPVVYLLCRKRHLQRLWLAVAAVNVMTNLPLNGILMSGITGGSKIILLALEGGIVLIEAGLYRWTYGEKGFLHVSLLANLTSFLIGRIVL